MSLCEFTMNEEPCINYAVHRGGQLSYCPMHHELGMLNDPEYRESVSAWYVSPDVLAVAKEAEFAASIENIERALEMMEVQKAIQRGDDVVAEHKDQVFRRRFAALDKWQYRVKVRKELERAAAERAEIDADMSERLARDYNTLFRDVDGKTLGDLLESTRNLHDIANLDTRMKTEFGM